MSLVLAAAGCGGTDTTNTASQGAIDPHLGVVVPDSTSDTWDSLTTAAVSEGRDQGIEVSPDSADDAEVTAQVQKLQAFLPEKLDCFAIAPVDSQALVGPLQGFAKKDVPIFNIGLRLDEKVTAKAKLPVASFIGPADKEIGHQAVREMTAAVPAGGTVAMVVGMDSDSNAAQQREGFTEGAEGKLDLITTEATNNDYPTAVKVVAEALSANPSLKGIFASSDTIGRAAVEAVAAANLAGSVTIVSVGGTLEALKAVKAGQLAATIATYPASVGSVLVRACRQVIDGKTVKPRLTTQSLPVNKDNVDAELASYPNSTQPFPDPLM